MQVSGEYLFKHESKIEITKETKDVFLVLSSSLSVINLRDSIIQFCSQTGKKSTNLTDVRALLEVRALESGWYPASTIPSHSCPTEIIDRHCTTTSSCLNAIEYTCTRALAASAPSTAADTRA